MTDLLKYRFNKTASLLLFAFLASCKMDPEQFIKNTNVGGALGTSYSIIYLFDKELDFQHEIDSVFSAMNQSLSTYIPTSDISKINQGNTDITVDHNFSNLYSAILAT